MIDYTKLWTKTDVKGMKDWELAKSAGISVMTIFRMRKNHVVSVNTLLRIATVTDCTVDELPENPPVKPR